ncbi:MAG: CopG family antitoxin [Patescibacteria group bacterium]
MKKKIDKIPKFKNIKEEAEFWDTHSFADYWDKWKEVDMVFELDKPREASLVLRLQKAFKDNLKKIARSKGLDVSTLARMWLMEKVNEDLSARKFHAKNYSV